MIFNVIDLNVDKLRIKGVAFPISFLLKRLKRLTKIMVLIVIQF